MIGRFLKTGVRELTDVFDSSVLSSISENVLEPLSELGGEIAEQVAKHVIPEEVREIVGLGDDG